MGVLGFSLSDTNALSIRDIDKAINFKRDYENAQLEAQIQSTWEQTRLICAYVLMPYSKKKISSAQDLFSFPWEGESTVIKDIEAYKAHRREVYARILAKEAEEE